jgi:hypothetical protein
MPKCCDAIEAEIRPGDIISVQLRFWNDIDTICLERQITRPPNHEERDVSNAFAVTTVSRHG